MPKKHVNFAVADEMDHGVADQGHNHSSDDDSQDNNVEAIKSMVVAEEDAEDGDMFDPLAAVERAIAEARGIKSGDLSKEDLEALEKVRDKRKSRKMKQKMRKAAEKNERLVLPPDHLRKVIKEQGDLRSKAHKDERKLFLGGMSYMPLAIQKFLENIPMPWETAPKKVRVVYHIGGVLTIVEETPKVSEPHYLAQWGSTWTAMRQHKVQLAEEGKTLHRREFPIFGENEAPIDYVDYFLPKEGSLTGPAALQNQFLDSEGSDEAVFQWLYAKDPRPMLVKPNQVSAYIVEDTVRSHFRERGEKKRELMMKNLSGEKKKNSGGGNGDAEEEFEDDEDLSDSDIETAAGNDWGKNRAGGRWYFSVEVLANLLRLAHPIVNYAQSSDPNSFFLWDIKSFYVAKALHIAIPRGARFESNKAFSEEELAAQDRDWSDFNSMDQIITRPKFSMRTEGQIQFPHLYGESEGAGGGVSSITSAPTYHYPTTLRIPTVEGTSVPTFTFGLELNPILPVSKNFTDDDIRNSIYHRCKDTASKVWEEEEEGEELQAEFDDIPGLMPYNPIPDVGGNMMHSKSDLIDYGFNVFTGETNSGEDDCGMLLEGFEPFLSDLPIEDPATKEGINVYFAPAPFNTFGGGLRRRLDVDVGVDFARNPVHVVDDGNDYPSKVKESYTRLLKGSVKRRLIARRKARQDQRSGKTSSSKLEKSLPRRLDQLKDNKFFQQTEIDWLEAGLQLVRQGHMMLRQLLNMKSLPYVQVDFNFDSKFTKTPTTKERKKSRLGPAYHLLREFLKLVKYVVDLHVEFRRGVIDCYQLADGVHYLFTHLEKLNRMYQYKRRSMKQVQKARALKRLLYYRFNVGEVQKGPGNGLWAPAWRTWVFFFRGMTPMLQRFLGNLVNRMLEGRKHKAVSRRITKQRIESNMDVNIKEDFRKELMDVLPAGVKPGVISRLDQHFNAAFRAWKKHATWDVPDIDPVLTGIIRKYVNKRAEQYQLQAQYGRERINSADAVDKTMFKKNLGRMTRIKLMDEMDRQQEYLRDGPALTKEESVGIYGLMAQWLDARGYTKIPFPKQGHPAEVDLLTLSLSRLRDQHNIQHRLTQTEREEQKRIEDSLNNVHDALGKIRDSLVRQRLFKPIAVEYIDSFSHLTPIYSVAAQEKIVDAYLDQYLWFEATERTLFPNWVKPADSEPLPVTVHQWCEGINRSPGVWETKNGESVIMFQTSLEEQFYNNIDWVQFRPILELIMDKTLVDYIVARHAVKVEYKDMEYNHSKGLIRGFQFSAFLAQVWGLVIDLLMIGSQRAQQIAGINPVNRFLRFEKPQFATCHPIRGYSRYKDTIHMFMKFTKDQADVLRMRYLEEVMEELGTDDEDVLNQIKTVAGYKNKKCWPMEARMRLNEADVTLGRAVMHDLRGRLPPAIADITWDTSFVSVYSAKNPNLLFDFAGFEVRIQPAQRDGNNNAATAAANHQLAMQENVWPLRGANEEITARAFLQVSKKDVVKIQNKIRHAIMMVGNATFQSIAAKWNAVVTGIIPYYREAIHGTAGLQEIFAKGEMKMQKRVMMALNSKDAKRFPPVIFYAPQDPTGGLGMLSVGQSLIPANDRMYSRSAGGPGGAQAFMSGLTNSDDITIPNVLNYFTPWHVEIEEGARAWRTFISLKQEARAEGKQVSFDDIRELQDKGIPRIGTQFREHAKLYRFDRGFRARQEFQQFMLGKFLKNWWFHNGHDGSIAGNLKQYHSDMNQALGGVEAMLEHSLFKATGLTSWEGIYWNSAGSFEQSKKDAKLTKAQRGGLTSVPNRRFALWWSPTINRSDVFTGYPNQIHFTGIIMYGKLETIKKSLIELFLPDRWEKTHVGVVSDISYKLKTDACMDTLAIETVSVEQIPPQKSYTFQSSAADIVLFARSPWKVSDAPSLLTESPQSDRYSGRSTARKFWIDVQVRWGNYDEHNVAQYARDRFTAYTSDGGVSRYPSAAGIVVAIDLAYNCCSAYGYWIPELKPLLQKLMDATMRSNTVIASLRDRMKRALQLQTSNPTESNLTVENISELFSDQTITWIVDDSQTRMKGENGAVTIYDPRRGHLYFSVVHRSVFTGQKRAKKLASDKAAEEVSYWINTLPEIERPKKIVVTRSRFRGPLSNVCPNVIITQADVNMEISQLASHPKLGGYRTSATESKTYSLNVYDDWLNTFSPPTAFRILKLILRGYFLDINRTKEILEPNASVHRNPRHFWPTYSPQEWEEVAGRLQETILANVCARLHKSVTDLTEKEKEDIIMGKKFTSDETQAEDIAAMEAQRKTMLETAEVVTTVNKSGETVTKTIKSKFEFGKTSTTADWRSRAVLNSDLPIRCEALYVSDPTSVAAAVASAPSSARLAGMTPEICLPDGLVKKFLASCDTRMSVMAYLFGIPLPQTPHIIEVRCILVPPQTGGFETISTPAGVPVSNPLLDARTGMQFVGILRTQASDDATPNTVDAARVSIACNSIQGQYNITSHGLAYFAQKIEAEGDEVSEEDAADRERTFGEFQQRLAQGALLPPSVDGEAFVFDPRSPDQAPLAIVLACIQERQIVLRSFRLTQEGYNTGVSTATKLASDTSLGGSALANPMNIAQALPCNVRATTRIQGSILCPSIGGSGSGCWNFAFSNKFWEVGSTSDGINGETLYAAEVVDEPLTFFGTQHHAEHFRSFRKALLAVTSSAAASSMGLVDADDAEEGGALGGLVGNFS